MTGLLVFLGLWCFSVFCFTLGWVCAGLCRGAQISDEWLSAIEEAESNA